MPVERPVVPESRFEAKYAAITGRITVTGSDIHRIFGGFREA